MKSFILIFTAFIYTFGFTQNITVSNGAIFEGEPYIAINPTNPQHLISAWMGYQFGQKVVIKSSISYNGGTSWSSPLSQTHLLPGNSSADPSLGFDHLGNAYLCYIDYDNVGFTNGSVVVAKSTNGAIFEGEPYIAINPTNPQHLNYLS